MYLNQMFSFVSIICKDTCVLRVSSQVRGDSEDEEEAFKKVSQNSHIIIIIVILDNKLSIIHV